jgi:hypothetical protein
MYRRELVVVVGVEWFTSDDQICGCEEEYIKVGLAKPPKVGWSYSGTY